MVGWHHQFNQHELEQTLGDGERQGREPDLLQSMGSLRVGHDWVTELNWYLLMVIHYMLGFPGGTMVKNPPANAGDVRDVDLIPGLERSPGTHSNIHARRIPWIEESGRLQSRGWQESDMTEETWQARKYRHKIIQNICGGLNFLH